MYEHQNIHPYLYLFTCAFYNTPSTTSSLSHSQTLHNPEKLLQEAASFSTDTKLYDPGLLGIH